MIKITISDDVRALCTGITIAYATILNLGKVNETKLNELINSTIEEVKKSYTLEHLKYEPIIRAYRDFYWHYLKIDPTKTRPASEALIRRILRGKPFPRINPIVDIGNIISIKTRICVGLYDIDKLTSKQLVLRKARKGEVFHPIGGKPKELDESKIVLAEDSRILHIFPHRDSILTAIDDKTKNVLLVTCGVPGISKRQVVNALDLLKETLYTLMGGEYSETFVETT